MAFDNIGFDSDSSKNSDKSEMSVEDIDDNREEDFEIETGRFRGDDGEFEVGPPPEDYDADVNRFRALDGQFKDRSADLLDEPQEALEGDPSFEG